jgi:phosphoinositide-3-kinase regulatory subunit 4
MVVKIYFKREKEGDLRREKDQIERIKNQLSQGGGNETPNVMPYAYIVDSPRAAYLVRQYSASTIKERARTPPGLTVIEKKWLEEFWFFFLIESFSLFFCF